MQRAPFSARPADGAATHPGAGGGAEGGARRSGWARVAWGFVALERWLTPCERPRVRALAIGAALLLCAPVLWGRFVLDDFMLLLWLEGGGGIEGLSGHPLDLFMFVSGEVERTSELMRQGAGLAWWTLPEVKAAFMRPLSALTHVLDASAWPRTPALMYAHSLVWLGLVLGLAALVYTRLCGSAWVAGVATLLFALDEAHAQTVGWISNRNAFVATAFALGVLIAHDRWRSRRSWAWAAAACALLVLGLLAGEFAIGIGAYLLAYAVCKEEGPWHRRLLTLAPYAALVIVWRVVYRALGYGVYGIATYIDPLGDFGRFVRVLPQRAAVLWSSQLGGPPADAGALGPPWIGPLSVALACLGIALTLWLMLPTLKARVEARFWALGSALATLPVSATWPSDRLLLLSGLGAMALIAHLLQDLAQRARQARLHPLRVVLGASLVFGHLIVAPATRPVRALSMTRTGAAIDAANDSLPSTPEVRGQTHVIVNVPSSFVASYLQFIRAFRGEPRPAHIYWLATTSSPVQVTRRSDRVLRVTPEEGFLYGFFERHFRDPRFRMPVGHEVALDGMTARVVALTGDGRPAAVDFVFDAPLESSRYAFWQWQNGRFAPFVLEKGASAAFDTEYLAEALLAAERAAEQGETPDAPAAPRARQRGGAQPDARPAPLSERAPSRTETPEPVP